MNDLIITELKYFNSIEINLIIFHLIGIKYKKEILHDLTGIKIFNLAKCVMPLLSFYLCC